MRRMAAVFLMVAALLAGLASPASAQIELEGTGPAPGPDPGSEPVVVEGGDQASAHTHLGPFDTDCPWITDSLYRLYSAYFLREPDLGGWAYWLSVYGSGPNTNLEVVSDSFVRSAEFVARYGHLSNAEFVTLVYQNVLGRNPDPVGLDHWVTALNNGYHRGSVMIAFSESEEYVLKTGTLAPAAGFLQWYDRSFRYECGVDLANGTHQDIAVPGDIPTPYVDVFTLNTHPTSATDFHVDEVRHGAGQELFWYDALSAQTYGNVFNVDLLTDTTALRLRRNAVQVTGLYWSVVFYDHPHSTLRPGWGGYDWLTDTVS